MDHPTTTIVAYFIWPISEQGPLYQIFIGQYQADWEGKLCSLSCDSLVVEREAR